MKLVRLYETAKNARNSQSDASQPRNRKKIDLFVDCLHNRLFLKIENQLVQFVICNSRLLKIPRWKILECFVVFEIAFKKVEKSDIEKPVFQEG